MPISNRFAPILFLAVAVMVLPGCEAIGAIFEAGVWVGVLIVLAVLGVIGFIMAKMRG